MGEADRLALRRELRALARELSLTPTVADVALECGLFDPGEPQAAHLAHLRRMRRLMLDLGVNAAGAALLVRMRQELMELHAEVERLRRFGPEW